jgi:hypothetical protein
MNGERNRIGSVGGSIVLVGLAMVLAALPALTGCESDAGADSNSLLTPQSGSALGTLSPPTLAELKTGAGLSEAQGKAIEPALSRWWEQASSMERRRDGWRAGPGPGPGGARMQEPPMHAFLQDAAANLDTDGFVAVVGYLAERRDAHRAQMRETRTERQTQRQSARQDRRGLRGDGSQAGLRGDGPRAGMRGDGPQRGARGDGPGAGMRGLLADLELTADQRAALRDAMRAAHETLRTMHTEIADGNLNADGARSRAQAAVDALEQSLQAGLTAGHVEALTSRMRERAQEMAGRRLEHVDAMGERHDGFLVNVLALDDAQAAALERARNQSQDRMRGLLEGIQGGGVTFPDAVYGNVSIHQDADAAIRALLTEDQIRKLDALEQLRRGGGPRLMGIYL